MWGLRRTWEQLLVQKCTFWTFLRACHLDPHAGGHLQALRPDPLSRNRKSQRQQGELHSLTPSFQSRGFRPRPGPPGPVRDKRDRPWTGVQSMVTAHCPLGPGLGWRHVRVRACVGWALGGIPRESVLMDRPASLQTSSCSANPSQVLKRRGAEADRNVP